MADHPEDYCHKCGQPNISWFGPSSLWNQSVREAALPEILCPVCFVKATEAAGFAGTTWRVEPRDYEARYYFCSCGGALTADEYIEHYFEKGHDRGDPAFKGAATKPLSQIRAELGIATKGKPDAVLLDSNDSNGRSISQGAESAVAAAQEIVNIAYRDKGQVPHRDTIAAIIQRHLLR